MKKKRKSTFFVVIIMMAALVFAYGSMTNSAYAQISHNAAAEFSTTDNPNSHWSYRWADFGFANSTSSLMEQCCVTGGGWRHNLPDLWSIAGGSYMHPGNYSDSILAFSMPADFVAGTVSLHIDISDSGTGGNGAFFSIWKNDTQLTGGNYFLDGSFASFAIDEDISMGASDTVYLRLNKNGGHSKDGINIDTTFTQTAVAPEPISSTLFIVGGLVLGFRRFRRKR